MLKPAKMKKISLLIHEKDKDLIITKLHELGVVELREVRGNGLESVNIREELKDIISLQMSLASVRDVLNIVKEQKSGFSLPKPPEKIKVKKYEHDELIDEVKRFLDDVGEKIKSLERKYNKNNEKISELKENLGILEKLSELDVDLSYIGVGKRVFVKVGYVDKKSLEDLKKDLKDFVFFVKEYEDYALLVVIGLTRDVDTCDEILRKYRFSEVKIKVKGKPSEVVSRIKDEIEKINSENSKVLSEIKEYKNKYEKKILAYMELLDIERERLEAFNLFGRTKKTYLIEGYIPEKHLNKTINELKNYDCYVDISEPKSSDDVPVYLDNPKIFKPFEILTEAFATPKYNEFDPTPLLAVWFILFFGFMLTDFVYGLIVALIGFFLYKRFWFKSAFRDIGIILILGGISSMVFGIAFGSYFGNVFEMLKDLKIASIDVPSLINPFKSEPIIVFGKEFMPIMFIFVLSLLIGIVHLNIGFLLGLIKANTFKEKLGKLWFFILELGAVAYLLNIKTLGYALIIISIVLLIYVEGILGIFNITGLFGDILSYARLLALSLATGGIALAINLVVVLVTEMIPYIGAIIAALIFIIGHFINTILQALGSFIHGLRLHYVEFFTKFYEGGGKKYSPFRIKRIYTEEEV